MKLIHLFPFLQAVWIFMTLLPTLMLNTETRNVPLGSRDYIGWTIWGIGFATEAIADQQKWLFKRDPDNAVSKQARYSEQTLDASFECKKQNDYLVYVYRGNSSRVDCGATADILTTWERSCSGRVCGSRPRL